MERERDVLAYARKRGMTEVQARKLLERERKAKRRRDHAHGSWATAKSFVHCCGQWYPVISVPMVAPCCGRQYMIVVRRNHLHLGCIDRDQLIAHGVVEAENTAGGID